MTVSPLLFDVAASGLSDDEQQMTSELGQRLDRIRGYLQSDDDYYNGEQITPNLGISVPRELEALRTVVGWPQVVVDKLDERLDVEGFRLPDSTDADSDLWDIWMANRMDQESELANLDALVFGRAYVMVGSGNCGPGDPCPPLITVESPLNMTAAWDAASRRITAALQVYEFDGEDAANLYLPDVTVRLIRPEDGGWKLFDRDEHNLGLTPVVMLANRQRAHDRYGRSEITPAVRALTDAACRTVLGMEVAREFFSTPQRYILGANESDFQDAEGNTKSAWETYIGRVLALERDGEGNVPDVGSFATGDPSTFTRVIEVLARTLAGIADIPPHYLGYASDNPASADAIRSAESGLVSKAKRKQRAFEGAWRDVMRLALLMRDRDLPDDSHQLDVLWADPATPTPAATTDAITKQIQAGALPAESEVTLEKLGYSAVQRARIRTDRKRAQGADVLAQIAEQVGGTAAGGG